MTILQAIAITLSSAALASTAPDDAPDTIVVRGERMHVWPVENLIARGFDLKRIPRDENAAWVYIEAINAHEELPNALADELNAAAGDPWTEDRDTLIAYLQRPGNVAALEALEKAAAMKQCQLPYFGDSTQSLIAVLLPNLSHMRFLARLAVADGRRMVFAGDTASAADRYFAVMRMSAHVSQGTTLIEGLVALATWALANDALRDMVLHSPLSADELRAIARNLDQLQASAPSVRRGLASERVFGTAIVDELCARPFRLPRALAGSIGGEPGDGVFVDGDVNPVPDDGWGRLEKRIGQLILPDRAIKKHMLGYYDTVLDAAGRPRSERVDIDEERYLRDKVPQWDVITRSMLPSLSRSVDLGHRAGADRALTRVALALRLHMTLHNGQPPESLDHLEPPLPEGAAIDPFTGESLIYRPGPPGWVVYSVSANLIDDGGVMTGRWDEQDIVCRYPPEPIEPAEEDDE